MSYLSHLMNCWLRAWMRRSVTPKRTIAFAALLAITAFGAVGCASPSDHSATSATGRSEIRGTADLTTLLNPSTSMQSAMALVGELEDVADIACVEIRDPSAVAKEFNDLFKDTDPVVHVPAGQSYWVVLVALDGSTGSLLSEERTVRARQIAAWLSSQEPVSQTFVSVDYHLPKNITEPVCQ